MSPPQFAQGLLCSVLFEPARSVKCIALIGEYCLRRVMTEDESDVYEAHSVERRLYDLKREVDDIKRLITQASLKRLTTEIERQELEIDEVKAELHCKI